ncbi:leucine-rich repeat protein [Draconibacterium sp. IB214405]|uniref:leucine-rich repeat protein n=1 Tax=Draconibacterium sp. IB214405 TaxID=3097352 RepID=UPI002A0ECC4C|nr:leucine-rich repeat protein [Draconibacterium sp. IB214405]MDX8339277.1 leucine-rich repeat protein [Draconibacterium sp. IB214405]
MKHTFYLKPLLQLLLWALLIIYSATTGFAQSYTLTDEDVVVENGVITSCINSYSSTAIVIPDTLDGQLVTGIGASVFKTKLRFISKITFPSGLESIGDHSFSGTNYMGLDTADFAKCQSLASIGIYAFYGNDLVEMNLNSCTSLETIGDYAFKNNNLPELDLSSCNELAHIGVSAFESNKISNLNLNSSSLKTIGDYAFQSNLVGELILDACPALTEIGEYVFYQAGITAIDLSGCTSLESIGLSAFYGSLATSVDFSACSSLKYIGQYAFKESYSLQTVNFANCTSLLSIGFGAFQITQIESVDLSNCTSLQTIGDQAFYNNGGGISSLTLGNIRKLTYIGTDAFSGGTPTLKEFVLPVSAYDGVQGWEDNNGTVWNAGDTVTADDTYYSAIIYYTLNDDDVVVEDGKIVSSVEHFPFLYIDIPDTLDGQIITGIGDHAFLNRNLSSVTVPTTLRFVETYGMAGNNFHIVDLSHCTQLTNLAWFAFYASTAVDGELILPTPNITGKIFNYWDVNGTYYPAGSVTTDASCIAVFSYYATFSVTDTSLNPILSATVELDGYGNKSTNSEGVAVFDSVWAGTNMAYTISALGYNEANGVINVSDTSVIENVILSPESPSRHLDSLALVALFNATDGLNWNNDSNWLSTEPIDTWYGITVDSGRVTGIELDENNLAGLLPESIGLMDQITNLHLSDNQLSGSLPSELFQLNNIERIDFAGNQFSGSVSSEFGNLINLTFLGLTGNEFTGDIPVELGNLENLQILGLNFNSLSGTIPTELGNCTSLSYLNLRDNDLIGGVPIELCNSSLNYISLENNYLDSTSCPTIQCLLQNEVIFIDDSTQIQKSGYELLTMCSEQDTLLPLELSETVSDALCNGGHGTIVINISGGLGGSYGLGGQTSEALTDSNSYVVMVYDMDTQSLVEEEVLPDASDSTLYALVAGAYQVIIEDNAGNEAQVSVIVSEPEMLFEDISVRGIASFPGDTLEIIDVAAFGGTAPYQFQVYQDGVLKYPYTEVDSFVVPTGAAYEVLVRDATGCLTSAVVFIETPSSCSQHFYPIWEGNGVYDPMNIFVVDAKIDGVDLEPGDQVGVFDDTICVGYGKVEQTIEGENILSIVVGADDGTGTGYTPGNEISYRIWRCNDQKEFSSVDKQCYTNESVPITCSSFQVGASSYVALSVTTVIDFASDFYPGWNIFSAPVNPDSTDLEFVFSNLINTSILLKIQDETGASLEDYGTFGGWINNIGNLHPAEGYKVKVTEYDSLYITGQLVNYPYGIILNSGWNIIGFPSMQVVDGMEVVQQLLDKGTLIKVQDQQGNSIEDLGMFGGWQNFIGSFWAGRGFKVKVSAPDTLWVYEDYVKSSTIRMESVGTSHFKLVFEGNGVDHMNFNFVNLSAGMINLEDELAVFDGDNCVGAITLLPEHFEKNLVSIPASAADNGGMVGFIDGNNYSFRLWQAGKQMEMSIEPELIKGEPYFVKHESAILSMKLLEMDVEEPYETTEIRSYPNPFNEEITVNIQLAADAKIEVQVMNQTGQVVNRLVERQVFPHGSHNLIWGGKNDGGQSVSSGIYYLRITIGDRMYNKKIVYNR